MIDLNCFYENLGNVTESQKLAAAEFLKNLEIEGCCKITCSKLIPKEELSDFVKDCRLLLKIKKELKILNALDRNVENHAKKYGFREKLSDQYDNFEYFINGNYHELNGLPKQQFQGLDESLLSRIKAFQDKMAKLTMVILEALGLSLENSLHFFMKDNNELWNDLVLLSYPWMCNHRTIKAAHYDYSAISILHTTNAGLQFEVNSENEVWKDVRTEPGEFVVNCGEILEALTNKRLKSPFHRVIGV